MQKFKEIISSHTQIGIKHQTSKCKHNFFEFKSLNIYYNEIDNVIVIMDVTCIMTQSVPCIVTSSQTAV